MSASVGLLALQGDYAEHRLAFDRIGVSSREVRKARELDELRALVIPGGESTTMLKFLEEEHLMQPLRRFHASGGAIFGTCAGAILLAKQVTSPEQPSLGLIDITVERNAYGRQIDSHESEEPCPPLGDTPLSMVFIRAPVIRRTGPSVSVLAYHRGQPVLVREGRVLVSSFHPELTADERVHRYFIEDVANLTAVGSRSQV